ncbi:MAG: pyridoxamine 5'-phosphate oxidase family protein, partial [Geodermatophilaceae bacterium]
MRLTEPACLEFAATMPVDRLAYVAHDRISVIPVNYLLEGRDVLASTTPDGDLMAAAQGNAIAALEVDDLVAWSRSGWSVLIRGRLEEETDADRSARCWTAVCGPGPSEPANTSYAWSASKSPGAGSSPVKAESSSTRAEFGADPHTVGTADRQLRVRTRIERSLPKRLQRLQGPTIRGWSDGFPSLPS